MLLQAIAVVLCQTTLLELCITVRSESRKDSRGLKHFFDLNITDFWNWDDFKSYLQAIASVVLLLMAFSALFIDNVA